MPLFEKLRVSLDEAFEEAPILDAAGHRESMISRSEYMYRAFGEARRFLKTESTYDFHPLEAPNGYVGRIVVFHLWIVSAAIIVTAGLLSNSSN